MIHRIPLLIAAVALLFSGCASSGAVESTSNEAASSGVAVSSEMTPAMPETVTLDDALATADALAGELNAYEEQRAQTMTQVDEASSQALNALENASSADAVREATRTWRQNWNAVREEVNLLATRYAAVSATAVGYFHHLDAQTAQISDDGLRAEEQERNDEIHASWRSTSNDALQALRTLRANLQTGDDLYVTMLNASLRSGFDTHIEHLRSLSEDSKAALEELQAVTEEGESLVGSLEQPSPQPSTAASDNR
jgi:hypothetical protein